MIHSGAIVFGNITIFSPLCALNLGYNDNNLESQIIFNVPGASPTPWQNFTLIELDSEKGFLLWYTTLNKLISYTCLVFAFHLNGPAGRRFKDFSDLKMYGCSQGDIRNFTYLLEGLIHFALQLSVGRPI